VPGEELRPSRGRVPTVHDFKASIIMSETQGPMALPEHLQVAKRLEGIFMPHATGRRDTLYTQQLGFVHYTSAEAALNIINEKRLWLRNTTCMADYREVQHGSKILNNFFADQSKSKEFIETLDTSVPGIAQEAISFFNQW
jgi:hypothetical protein